MKEFASRLKGVVVPMVTIFDDEDDLDEAAIRRLTSWLIENGAHALFPCSGSGEVWKLSGDERRRLATVVIHEARRRVPVICGAGAGSTREAIEHARFAREAGADAIMVWPPYFAGASYRAEGIFEHFKLIADAAPIPMIVYDAPEITGYPLPEEVVARLAGIENVVGVKDSTGSMAKFARELAAVGDRIAMLQGWSALFLPSLALGAPGGIISPANVCPRLLSDLYSHFQAGRLADAQEHHRRLMKFLTSPPWTQDQLQTMKESLTMLGLTGGRPRRPWFAAPLTDELKQQLRSALAQL